MARTITMASRFRGFLPIVIDLETGGLNSDTDALLEIAAIPIAIDDTQQFVMGATFHEHINAHPETRIHPDALKVNKIKPDHPFRFAIDELTMLQKLHEFISLHLKNSDCNKAIITGHNVAFDLNFLQTACARHNFKLDNMHSFSCIDTVSLGAVFYGETILARILHTARIKFNHEKAHSALYDTQKTAELFCKILNHKINI